MIFFVNRLSTPFSLFQNVFHMIYPENTSLTLIYKCEKKTALDKETTIFNKIENMFQLGYVAVIAYFLAYLRPWVWSSEHNK